MFTKTNCLSSLIGIRTGCPTPSEEPPFYLEDIEGLDIHKLSKLAIASEGSGANVAQNLITSAAREMMGDIEALMNNGYSIKQMLGDVCSSCSLLPSYTSNTGIIIKSIASSKYQILKVTQLTILANVTGTKVLVFDDGITQETYNVALQAGVKMPVLFDYTTTQKSVKVYFQDTTVPLGVVSCATTSSCGCGGSTVSNNPISISGLSAGLEVSTQYGFIACAGVGCSNDSLVCGMIKHAPNFFGLALMYKVGEKYTYIKAQSERNNETASYTDGEPAQQGERRFGQLYWAKMKGSKGMKGISNVISDYLRNNARDNCVECDAKIYSAYVTG